MHRLRKLLKVEMDVELIACAHGISMIFFYGIVMWIAGERSVSFLTLLEMIILAYVCSWTQKLLFLRERVYSKAEYIVNEVMWNLMPSVFVPAAGALSGWFDGMEDWVSLSFYILMGCYFVLVWLFLRYVNYEETLKMNRWLKKRKEDAASMQREVSGAVRSQPTRGEERVGTETAAPQGSQQIAGSEIDIRVGEEGMPDGSLSDTLESRLGMDSSLGTAGRRTAEDQQTEKGAESRWKQ